jgi:hypothetical protein
VLARSACEARTRPTATWGVAHDHAGQRRLVGRPTLGPNAGPSAHGVRRAHAHGDGTDSGFGSDGARRQHSWNGKDGELGRRRGEKAANAAVGRRTRRRLRSGRGFGPGWRANARGEARGQRRTAQRRGVLIWRRRRLRADTVGMAARRPRGVGQHGAGAETVRSERRRGQDGAVESPFNPTRACPDSAAHGSQPGCGAR